MRSTNTYSEQRRRDPRHWTQRLTEKLRSNPAFRDISNDLQLGGSITHISIDRSAAARFGLTASDVDEALYDAFGQRQINEFQTQSTSTT